MFERFFKTDSTPRRLRNGPAGPFLDGFAESMCAAGYTSETSGCYLHAADHLGQWAARRGVPRCAPPRLCGVPTRSTHEGDDEMVPEVRITPRSA